MEGMIALLIEIKQLLEETAEKVDNALEECFERLSGAREDNAKELLEAMKYSVLGGGKRIRAYITLHTSRMFGGDESAAMPYACALEVLHAYSLIHDDLPCMDNDDMRRGKPSCHKKFGEAVALLAGDSLLTLAFDLIASNDRVSDKSARLATATLSKLAGYLGMCGGQELDLSEGADTYDELKHLHSLKTGALIRASALLGLYAANDTPPCEVVRDLSSYAESVGLAFQIHDDILDVSGDSATLGKPVGSDEKNGKKTSLSFMDIREAEDEENRLTLSAVETLSDYPGSEALSQLAVWLMTREK